MYSLLKRGAITLFLLFALANTTTRADTVRKFYVKRLVSGTLNRITIGGGTRNLQLGALYYQCVVACTWSLTKRGTLSGGSSGAALLQKYDERAPDATFTVTLDGTVTSGVDVQTPPVTLSANSEKVVGGGMVVGVSATNYITAALTSSDSGNLYVYFEVYEL